MATALQAAPDITIDVTNDLVATSDLSKLIPGSGKAVLQLASTLSQYAGRPISAASGSSSPTLKITASPKWTAGPVSFSLTPEATCTISIANQGESLKIATKVDDLTNTTDVQLAPMAGMTYVNIDLDFDITGDVSANGTAYGITITGKATGSASTTLSFCQPVPSGTETLAALKMAFSNIVFPTAPDSVRRMANGSSCRMNFDGSLSWELDLDYGLADYKLSAPSAGLVQQSIEKVAPETLTLPSAEIKAGATASVKYSHTDHFGLVVEKQDGSTAFLYLVRSATNEFDESAGITAGVTTTPVSVTVDPTRIQQTVQNVTKSATLATSVLNVVAPEANNFQSAALAKLNTLIADGNGNAGLSLALSQQTGRTALLNYRIDLSQVAAATQSWGNLLSRRIQDAGSVPGLTLLPGSGVTEKLEQSTTLQFHFFNLYKYSAETDFFNQCTSELGPDGAIRIIFDTGIEGTVTTNNAVDQLRIYFSGTATEDALSNVSDAEIDLHLEISEKGDSAGAVVLAQILTQIDATSFAPTIDQMNLYAQSNAGTLGLTAILKPSAYARLRYSAFTGNNPPQNQSSDMTNWYAIHEAAVNLTGFQFLAPWTYSDWSTFNSYCNTTVANSIGNRRLTGPENNVPSTFWGDYENEAPFVGYFFDASAEGMNLFEDLVSLANDLTSVTTDAQWEAVQKRVTNLVKGDLNIDYSKPIAAAILSMAAKGGATPSVSTAQASDRSSFTTTLTIA